MIRLNKTCKYSLEMLNIFREPFLYLIFNVFKVSMCEQFLSNYVDVVQAQIRETARGAPVLQDHFYEYENFTRDESKLFRKSRSTYFSNSCTGGNCDDERLLPTPQRRTLAYPVMMHCRGLLAYCKKECIALSKKECADWPFLCPAKVVNDIPGRCKIQCIHNYRQMRIKYPSHPKLQKDANPRYDRFDYY